MAEKICQNCGARCKLDDKYCKSCSEKLSEETIVTDNFLHGIEKIKWLSFLEVGYSRYMNVYEKYENKKFFLHINWAAFFFGIGWMIYRKMYKLAAIFMIVFMLLSFAVMACVAEYYADDIVENYIAIETYQEYKYNGGEDSLYEASVGIYDAPELAAAKEAEKSNFKIYVITYTSYVITALFLEFVVLGLFGDFIYRAHVIKNIQKKNGGVLSFWKFIGISFIFRAASVILTRLILYFFI